MFEKELKNIEKETILKRCGEIVGEKQDYINQMVPLVVQHANNLQKQLTHKSTSWSALNHKCKNQRDELDRQQQRLTKLKDQLTSEKRENARLKAENCLYARQLTIQAMQANGYQLAPDGDSFHPVGVNIIPDPEAQEVPNGP